MATRIRAMKWLAGLACAFLIIVAIAQLQKSEAQLRQEGIQFGDVLRETLQDDVVATGSLRPVASTIVGAQVSGTIVSLAADFNDQVKQGQVLARLDTSTFDARRKQAQAQLESATAQLALARDVHHRNRELQDRGFVSLASLTQSELQVSVAAAAVRMAQAQVDSAVVDLKNSVIKAPISGVVLSRNVEVGQTISATLQTPELFTLAPDLRAMRILANVREADISRVNPHGKVIFKVDAFPKRKYEGTVEQLRLAVSNTQGAVTYPLVISVRNEDLSLRPGMTAEVHINESEHRNGLTIPIAALKFRPEIAGSSKSSKLADDESEIFVRSETGSLKAKTVRLGKIYQDRIEVFSEELSVGDRVAMPNEK